LVPRNANVHLNLQPLCVWWYDCVVRDMLVSIGEARMFSGWINHAICVFYSNNYSKNDFTIVKEKM
jgi:hypothetical protein